MCVVFIPSPPPLRFMSAATVWSPLGGHALDDELVKLLKDPVRPRHMFKKLLQPGGGYSIVDHPPASFPASYSKFLRRVGVARAGFLVVPTVSLTDVPATGSRLRNQGVGVRRVAGPFALCPGVRRRRQLVCVHQLLQSCRHHSSSHPTPPVVVVVVVGRRAVDDFELPDGTMLSTKSVKVRCAAACWRCVVCCVSLLCVTSHSTLCRSCCSIRLPLRCVALPSFPFATRCSSRPSLWLPQSPSMPLLPLSTMVHDSLKNSDPELRKEMSSNVLVVGGGSVLPAFSTRLSNELGSLIPMVRV